MKMYPRILAATLAASAAMLSLSACHQSDPVAPACTDAEKAAHNPDTFVLDFLYGHKYAFYYGATGGAVSDKDILATAVVILKNNDVITIDDDGTGGTTDVYGRKNFKFRPNRIIYPEQVANLSIQYFVKLTDGSTWQYVDTPSISYVDAVIQAFTGPDTVTGNGSTIESSPEVFDTDSNSPTYCQWLGSDTYFVDADMDITLEDTSATGGRIGSNTVQKGRMAKGSLMTGTRAEAVAALVKSLKPNAGRVNFNTQLQPGEHIFHPAHHKL